MPELRQDLVVIWVTGNGGDLYNVYDFWPVENVDSPSHIQAVETLETTRQFRPMEYVENLSHQRW